jgi:YbbR domain-containing protein
VIPFRRPNIPIALLSILMSIGLWVHVQVQANAGTGKQSVNVRLVPMNLDDTLTADDLGTVPGTIVGSSDEAREIQESPEVRAEVDLRNPAVGARKPYRIRLVQGSVRIPINLDRDTVTVLVEKKLKRSVPVHVVITGKLPTETLQYVDSVVRPAEVIVEGPKSRVDSVSEVRALLDLGKVQPNTEYSIKVDALDSKDRPIPTTLKLDPQEVSIRPALIPSPQQKPVLIQPIFEGAVGFGYRVAESNGVQVKPNQTVVEGSSLDIARITTVNTNVIDITGLTTTTQFTATLDLPPGLGVVRGKPQTVTVIVRIEPVPQQAPQQPPRPSTSAAGSSGPG